MEQLQKALSAAGVSVLSEHPLAQHSTFRIGGKADLAIFPACREELIHSLHLLRASDTPFLVLGNASNVVFSDDGYRGAVIFTTGCRTITRTEIGFDADAGVSLASLAIAARDASLQGAEFAHGIPGTVGGALFMNAGAFGGCMADICIASEYYDCKTGTVERLTGDAHAFGNRTSVYERDPDKIVLGASFALREGEREKISALMQDLMARRRSTQPLEYPSAGSVFKRPVGHFAGKLIEDCGLKGLTVGGAQVSEKHAGFIINRGGATARDVAELVNQIQTTVFNETGVKLECEIRFL